jgi:phosphate transport system substrate-binding protein
MAQVQNRSGRFIEPSDRSGQVALASTAGQIPSNLRLFLPDPGGDESYPIVTYSWLLLYGRYPDRDKISALRKFVTWSLTEGQAYSRDLGYIPLPSEVTSLSLAALDHIE